MKLVMSMQLIAMHTMHTTRVASRTLEYNVSRPCSNSYSTS